MGVSKRFGVGLFWAMAMLSASVASAGADRPLADDKCVAECDEGSDKCMRDAGKDPSKQKQCDSAYDECLRKCG